MNITWYGQGCFKIEAKSSAGEVSLVVDPFDAKKTGLKLPRSLRADIILEGESSNHEIEGMEGGKPFIISGPGEYEIKDVAVRVIPLKNEESAEKRYLFCVEVENVTLVHTNGLGYVPTEAELQVIDKADILFVPVGGGRVLDAKKANQLVGEIQPRIVIPMYYKTPGLQEKFEDAQAFVRALGGKAEEVPKFKIVKKDLPVEDLKLVLLERAA